MPERRATQKAADIRLVAEDQKSKNNNNERYGYRSYEAILKQTCGVILQVSAIIEKKI